MAPTADTANAAPSIANQLGDFLSSMAITDSIPVPTVAAYMLVGGLLALYLQFLYRHCNSSSSTSDAVTRIFPLLTMATIGVVALGGIASRGSAPDHCEQRFRSQTSFDNRVN